MSAKHLGSHDFCFNSQENGGEHLRLITEFFDNGDNKGEKSVFTNQTIELQSYGNCAKIELYGVSLSPKLLRECADEMERILKNSLKLDKALAKMPKKKTKVK